MNWLMFGGFWSGLKNDIKEKNLWKRIMFFSQIVLFICVFYIPPFYVVLDFSKVINLFCGFGVFFYIVKYSVRYWVWRLSKVAELKTIFSVIFLLVIYWLGLFFMFIIMLLPYPLSWMKVMGFFIFVLIIKECWKVKDVVILSRPLFEWIKPQAVFYYGFKNNFKIYTFQQKIVFFCKLTCLIIVFYICPIYIWLYFSRLDSICGVLISVYLQELLLKYWVKELKKISDINNIYCLLFLSIVNLVGFFVLYTALFSFASIHGMCFLSAYVTWLFWDSWAKLYSEKILDKTIQEWDNDMFLSSRFISLLCFIWAVSIKTTSRF